VGQRSQCHRRGLHQKASWLQEAVALCQAKIRPLAKESGWDVQLTNFKDRGFKIGVEQASPQALAAALLPRSRHT